MNTPQEELAQIRKEMGLLESHIDVVKRLQHQEGWQLFQEAIRPDYEKGVAAAIETKDPYLAAKFLGAAKAARDLASWADREITNAETALLNLKHQFEQLSRFEAEQ